MELIRELGQLFVTVLLTGFGISVVIPAMTDVTVESVCPGRDQCSLAIYLAGFQQAITGFGAMFVIPLIGSLSDKYGRKSLLTVSIALSIMPPAILAYERSTSFFYAYYVMKTLTAMLCDGALLSLALAYTADKIPADRRISAFGIISGAFSASFLCGSFAARFLPIDATFKVAMGASLLATVYMRVFLEESIPYEIDELSQPISKTEGEGDVDVPELSRRALTTFKRVPSIKEVIRLLRSSSTFSRTAMVCFFNNLTLGWLQASLMYYLKDRFHSNKDQFASLMIFFGALGTISQMIVASSLSAIIGDERLLSVALFATFTYSFVLSIAWSFWTCSIASKQVGAHNQGKAQGCLFGIQSFAYAISPLIFNPLAALFLSEDAPFDFPGFSILCIGLNTLVAFVLSLTIKENPSISSEEDH
ncbi:uncharacterized protein LOC111011033 isoform X2 [Momordica charantia]|uniref:Uncharacterized protein LOC111011033 isoform X2 n=1 Tax=Momordica charantia TaxID=3673 RepID=A0A6J1CFG2_MOMCH|nr:uncharacterized protein LOC111011033 isoform X2 [Momordica charantia]